MIRECLEAHPATVQALIDFARKLIYGACSQCHAPGA